MKLLLTSLIIGSAAAFAPTPFATRAVTPKKTGTKVVEKKGTKVVEKKVAAPKKGVRFPKADKEAAAAPAKKGKPVKEAAPKKVKAVKVVAPKKVKEVKVAAPKKVKVKAVKAVKAVKVAAPKAPKVSTPRAASASAFGGELGVQTPTGLLDPLNLLGDASQERFDELRYTEIKHGRISMLAFAGNIITRAGIHLPGNIDSTGTTFDSIPNGWAALSAIPGQGLFQILFFIGILELFVMKDRGGGEFVGDFRNNSIDFGWDTFSEDAKYQKRGIELNNGRAAMLGIFGLMIHEQLGTVLPIVGQM
eukprot:CAMPEP_0194264900 /NCGR_PEP_ID=MMETSP0169-20130528/260_1 /TAXON_ID=218684 /ORGANISM="Corethron pennatum, Strain L29A3" /LENGTH=304 /DNA_ID=CAMNT_0039005231 /DNA_START=167 /DNA_END=1081 /DNA_ORIENTATION=-